MRKGIILAGGLATRLYPATEVISKQLLPIYDKPMVYYPLSVLMLAGIKEILLISTQDDLLKFQKLLKDGSQWGVKIDYAIQESPKGLAHAFIVAEDFLKKDPCIMILGDNVFYGHYFPNFLKKALENNSQATIFTYKVNNPQDYGVVVFDSSMQPKQIVEKPKTPVSKYAITGLYMYDHSVVEIAKSLKPSSRGELEISDLNQIYLEKNALSVEMMGRGIAWFDTGSFDSLLNASQFIEMIQNRQGVKIACLEEIAFRMGYITSEQLKSLAKAMGINSYQQYLLDILEDESY